MESDEQSRGKGEIGCTLTVAPSPSVVPGLRERQRASREDSILSAAMHLIAEVGYDAMTMEDLAEQAGISKPTLYQHFPSKEAIAVRAVVRVVERTIEFVQGLDASLPPMERLERIIRQIVTRRFVTQETPFGAARPAILPVLKARPEYQEAAARLIARVSAVVEEARIAGQVPPGRNTRLLVQMIFSLLRDSEYEDLIARGECTPDEVVETLVSVYFDGARSKTIEIA